MPERRTARKINMSPLLLATDIEKSIVLHKMPYAMNFILQT